LASANTTTLYAISKGNNSDISMGKYNEIIMENQKISQMIDSALFHLQKASDALLQGNDSESLLQADLAKHQITIIAANDKSNETKDVITITNTTTSFLNSLPSINNTTNKSLTSSTLNDTTTSLLFDELKNCIITNSNLLNCR